MFRERPAGEVCRRCGGPMAWPRPDGVIHADGTAEHHACRLLAAAARTTAGVTATTDAGELLRPGEEP